MNISTIMFYIVGIYAAVRIWTRLKYKILENKHWAKWNVIPFEEKTRLLYAFKAWCHDQERECLSDSARQNQGDPYFSHTVDYHLKNMQNIIDTCPEFEKLSLVETENELKKIIEYNFYGFFSDNSEHYLEHEAFLNLLFDRRFVLSELIFKEISKVRKPA